MDEQIKPVKGSRLCFCNYPDKPFDSHDLHYRVLKPGKYQIWNAARPGRIWDARISSCQNLVIGGGVCLDFIRVRDVNELRGSL